MGEPAKTIGRWTSIALVLPHATLGGKWALIGYWAKPRISIYLSEEPFTAFGKFDLAPDLMSDVGPFVVSYLE